MSAIESRIIHTLANICVFHAYLPTYECRKHGPQIFTSAFSHPRSEAAEGRDEDYQIYSSAKLLNISKIKKKRQF
jgi:hypothetical protein